MPLIRPMSDLRNRANDISELCHKEDQPVFITKNGKGDLISMCRPFIREPDLISRWAAGDSAPSTCISCDGCLKATTRREKLRCVQETRADGTPRKKA